MAACGAEDVIFLSSESDDEGVAVGEEAVGMNSNTDEEVSVIDNEHKNDMKPNGTSVGVQNGVMWTDVDQNFNNEIVQLLDSVPLNQISNEGSNGVTNGSQESTSNSIECIDLDDDIGKGLQLNLTLPTLTLTPEEVVKEDTRNTLDTAKERFQVKEEVLNSFKKSKKQKTNKPDDETPEERTDRKKRERIIQLENSLAKMGNIIEEYGNKEVDLEDEKNSSYLIRTRSINKYMECYRLICRTSGCNYYTGRPVEKRIRLAGITKCAELGDAVEKFMNSKPVLFIPDFHDIKKVVADFNAQARPPPLCDSEIGTTAYELFREVIDIMRKRRRQDMEVVCPLESTTSDPAESDEELRRKLEENIKYRKTEQEVIAKFAKQQEEKENAKEVEDEPASSGQESDNEDEEDDLDAERGSAAGNEEESSDIQVFTRDEVEDEDSDSESEDDKQPQPKKQRISSEKNGTVKGKSPTPQRVTSSAMTSDGEK